MSFSSPELPSHVKTVLVTGAGGFLGQLILASLVKSHPTVQLIATDIHPPRIPAGLSSSESKLVTSLAADLGDESSIATLFEGKKVDLVFALHGIMSGGSESDFELGYRVNVDSHVSLLKYTTKHSKLERAGLPAVVYVYASSQAVYGGPKCLPEAVVDPDSTPLFPESSYGVSKAIVELYVYDYSRRGFVDGRILRLPTVCVRSGLPSSAASSFISGLVREPLNGQVSVCPVADSPEDPNMDSLGVHVTSVKTVVKNIIFSSTVPASKFPAHSRTINLPGITTTPRKIIEALVKVGGEDKRKFVEYKRDAQVLAITAHWPGGFDPSYALSLGFGQDDPETGFVTASQTFKEELEAAAASK